MKASKDQVITEALLLMNLHLQLEHVPHQQVNIFSNSSNTLLSYVQTLSTCWLNMRLRLSAIWLVNWSDVWKRFFGTVLFQILGPRGCTFQNGLGTTNCPWRNIDYDGYTYDDFDWTVGSGSTNSYYTGPAFDKYNSAFGEYFFLNLLRTL